jgi:hypothetical protein
MMKAVQTSNSVRMVYTIVADLELSGLLQMCISQDVSAENTLVEGLLESRHKGLGLYHVVEHSNDMFRDVPL